MSMCMDICNQNAKCVFAFDHATQRKKIGQSFALSSPYCSNPYAVAVSHLATAMSPSAVPGAPPCQYRSVTAYPHFAKSVVNVCGEYHAVWSPFTFS